MGFLPKAGQASEALKSIKLNRRALRRRSEVLVIARSFTDVFKLHGETYKTVAYNPSSQEGVGFITGGARVALGVMYELYVRAPEGNITACINWVIEQAPEILAAKTDWDLGRAKEGRRVGEVTQSAYQLAEQYFIASMEYGNREQRMAHQAERRAAGYRSASKRGSGGVLTPSQRKQLAEVKVGLG